ncbi:PfkB family carbohydrate kinase, partial [Acinetobacter baumannii]
DPDEGIAVLSAQVPVLVVTHGAEGAQAVAHGERARVAAAPGSHVVDTTGAGDLFAAGFLFGHVRGLPLETCLKLGATCAAEV